jgi:hypothetical protein
MTYKSIFEPLVDWIFETFKPSAVLM